MFTWNSFAPADRFRVHRGDAVAALAAIPDGSLDAIVTDPPYGIALALNTTGKRRSIAGDGKLEARELWTRWIPQAWRVAKPNSAHLVFGSWKSPWMVELLARHFTVKGCICWDKRTIGLGWYLRPRWEMAYLVVKGKPPRRGVAPADLWECPRIPRPKHPCEKPVDLLRRAVRLVSDAGDVVLDPFCGIGSTGAAAMLEGRRFVGFELDPRYARMAQGRLTALLEEDCHE